MDIDGILAGEAKRSGGFDGPRAGWWRAKSDGSTLHRLYRFGEEKDLFASRYIHWLPEGGRPVDCTGEGCEVCAQVRTLYDNGSREAKDAANKMRRSGQMSFVTVLTGQPDGFNFVELNSKTGNAILLNIARIGGWGEGFPRPDQPEAVAMFK